MGGRRPSSSASASASPSPLRPPPFWISLLQFLRKAAASSSSSSPSHAHHTFRPHPSAPLHQLLLDTLRCSSLATHSLRYDHLPSSSFPTPPPASSSPHPHLPPLDYLHSTDSPPPSIADAAPSAARGAAAADIRQPEAARSTLRSLLRHELRQKYCGGDTSQGHVSLAAAEGVVMDKGNGGCGADIGGAAAAGEGYAENSADRAELPRFVSPAPSASPSRRSAANMHSHIQQRGGGAASSKDGNRATMSGGRIIIGSSSNCSQSSSSSSTATTPFSRYNHSGSCSSSTTASYATAPGLSRSSSTAADADAIADAQYSRSCHGCADSGEDRYSTAASSVHGIGKYKSNHSNTLVGVGKVWPDQSAVVMDRVAAAPDLRRSSWDPSTSTLCACPSSISSCFNMMAVSDAGADAGASSSSDFRASHICSSRFGSESFDSSAFASRTADDRFMACRNIDEFLDLQLQHPDVDFDESLSNICGSFRLSEFGMSADGGDAEEAENLQDRDEMAGDRRVRSGGGESSSWRSYEAESTSRCTSFGQGRSRRSIIVSSYVLSDDGSREEKSWRLPGGGGGGGGGETEEEEEEEEEGLRREVVYAWDPVAELAANIVEVMMTWRGRKTEEDVAAFLAELVRLNAPNVRPAAIALAFSRALVILQLDSHLSALAHPS